MNLRNFFLPPVVVTVADTPKIEKRLRAILSAGQRRGTGGLSRAGAATAVVFAAVAFVSLAVLRPVAVRAQQTPGDDTGQKDPQTACLSRLKQLGTAFLMYVQDYDDTTPPLGSPAQMRNRLSPYVRHNAAAFICPETNQPYQPVERLGGKVVALQVRDPSKTMFIHDTVPHPAVPGSAAVNGLWSVGYVDGHVKAVSTLPAIPALRPLPPAEQRARAAQVNLRAAQEALAAAQRRLQAQVRSQQRQESDISRLNIQAAQAELESARARLEAAQAEVAVAASTSDAQNTLPVSSEKVTVGPGRMFGSRPTFNVAYRVGKPDDGKGHLLLVVLTDQRGTHYAGSFGYPPGGMSTGGVLYLGSTPTMGTPVTIHVYDNGRLISEVTR